jgi:hypothetical protein
MMLKGDQRNLQVRHLILFKSLFLLHFFDRRL